MPTSALVVPGELAGSAATLFPSVDTDKVLLLMVVATTVIVCWKCDWVGEGVYTSFLHEFTIVWIGF